MTCCYIIYSQKLNKFYTGVTQDNLDERIEKHNSHLYGEHRFTAKASDWILFLYIEVNSFDHAVRLERKIKAMKSAKYILNLKKYPELIEKITSQTKST